jgi:hypothetical protein
MVKTHHTLDELANDNFYSLFYGPEFNGEEVDANREPYETQETKPTNLMENLTTRGIAAAQGEVERKSDRVDRRIVNVPVVKLPDPENVSSHEDFDHHISWEDAQTATKQLPEIQKEVNQRKTGDDFYDEDQAAGLDHSKGKKRIYDLYYGSAPDDENTREWYARQGYQYREEGREVYKNL